MRSTYSLLSLSDLARYWRVAANTLSAGTTYSIRVNVTDSFNSSNTAAATVIVQRTPLSVRYVHMFECLNV